jgi:hypothetical protein
MRKLAVPKNLPGCKIFCETCSTKGNRAESTEESSSLRYTGEADRDRAVGDFCRAVWELREDTVKSEVTEVPVDATRDPIHQLFEFWRQAEVYRNRKMRAIENVHGARQ